MGTYLFILRNQGARDLHEFIWSENKKINNRGQIAFQRGEAEGTYSKNEINKGAYVYVFAENGGECQ